MIVTTTALGDSIRVATASALATGSTDPSADYSKSVAKIGPPRFRDGSALALALQRTPAHLGVLPIGHSLRLHQLLDALAHGLAETLGIRAAGIAMMQPFELRLFHRAGVVAGQAQRAAIGGGDAAVVAGQGG